MNSYVRWKMGEPRERTVIAPLKPAHPVARFPCLVCVRPLGDGRPVQLLAVGPDSEDSRARCAAGRWFSALAITVHAECLGTKTEKEATGEQ